MKAAATLFGKGFCMGAADVVPGVSGGTMALILGIYARLVDAIRAFDLTAARLVLQGRIGAAARHVDLVFLVPLVAGIFAALMFFTRVVPLPTLIRTHPELIYGLFFGLILASVYVLLRDLPDLAASELGLVATGAAVGFLVVNLVPVSTPEAAWFVFLSGALAICAMILPGISGSFILLLLRKYAYVFDAIGRLDFTVILPFALGAVTGLMLFSRALSWLLHHYYRRTLSLIVGLLLGSLWVIWPFQERTWETVRGKARLVRSTPVLPDSLDATLVGAVVLAVTGIVLVLVLNAVAREKPEPESGSTP